MLRYGSKLLIFTDGDVWMVSSDGTEGAQTTGVNSHIGCPVAHGAVISDNDPFSIGRHAVWRWSEASLSEKTCKAENISSPIDSCLGESRLKDCVIFYNPTAGELWLHCKQDGITWIYGIDSGAWYSFEGFSGNKFFDMDGKVGFYRENKIFIFDESLIRDVDENGTEKDISATYISGIADPEDGKTRTLSRIALRGDLEGEAVTLEFIPHGCSKEVYVLKDNGTEEHSLIQKRTSSGRFKYGSFKLTASSNARQHIHGITLTAR